MKSPLFSTASTLYKNKNIPSKKRGKINKFSITGRPLPPLLPQTPKLLNFTLAALPISEF